MVVVVFFLRGKVKRGEFFFLRRGKNLKKKLSLFFCFTFGVDEPDALVGAGQRRVDGIARDARAGPGEDGGRGVAGELADSGCGGFFFEFFW